MLPSNIIFSDDKEALKKLLKGRRVFVIADRNVPGTLPDEISEGRALRFDSGEEAKSLQCIESLALQLLSLGADRDSMLLGIGGGATTDVTGLLASLFMRGIPFALVPTTLLAQIDASIGGKNGVNAGGFKNLLGTFASPEFIFSSASLRASEPQQSLQCGMAEMLKTFIIGDAESFSRAAHLRGEIPSDLVQKAASIKSAIVADDPFEKGRRKVLNLGHTFGHAIEKCSRNAVPHGLAVASGIMIAARLSLKLGIMTPEGYSLLESGWDAALLPKGTSFKAAGILDAVACDKKRRCASITLALPVKVGEVILRPVTMETINTLVDDDLLQP